MELSVYNQNEPKMIIDQIYSIQTRTADGVMQSKQWPNR